MAGKTINNPVTLGTAFTGINVIPGDTLQLRGGTYSGAWLPKLRGTAERRITVMPYKNERVILDGNFDDVASSFVDYIDIEFTTKRDGAYHSFSADGGRYINCTLHDSHGAGLWTKASLFYGCISYNHGYYAGDEPHGHSLYMQNIDPSRKKTVKHSIFGKSANFNMHAFSTEFPLCNSEFSENVFLPGRNLIGGYKPDDGVTFIGNHGDCMIGYTAAGCKSLVMRDNIAGQLTVSNYIGGEITDNLFVSDSDVAKMSFSATVEQTKSGLKIDRNNYYSAKASAFSTDQVAPYWMPIEKWRELYGWDVNGSFSAGVPDDIIRVYPNEYANVSKRKGLIVIWNWSGAKEKAVDLSPLGLSGTCKLLQGQDPLNDVREVVLPKNGIVTIQMSGTVALVKGLAEVPSAFPQFGCFVVE